MSSLDTLTSSVKRNISNVVVSGSFTDSDIQYYIQDATDVINLDYPDFGTYVVTVGGDIVPEPTAIDRTLLMLKSAELAYSALIHESIADAVMVRAGSITLDTSKSLGAFTKALESMRMAYRDAIDNLLINGSALAGVSSGFKLDNYKERDTDTEVSDSLV